MVGANVATVSHVVVGATVEREPRIEAQRRLLGPCLVARVVRSAVEVQLVGRDVVDVINVPERALVPRVVDEHVYIHVLGVLFAVVVLLRQCDVIGMAHVST